MHNHDYYQLIYFIKGQGMFFLGDREYHIENHSSFLIKPMQKRKGVYFDAQFANAEGFFYEQFKCKCNCRYGKA